MDLTLSKRRQVSLVWYPPYQCNFNTICTGSKLESCLCVYQECGNTSTNSAAHTVSILCSLKPALVSSSDSLRLSNIRLFQLQYITHARYRWGS